MPQTINDEQLRQLLGQGLSQREIAWHLEASAWARGGGKCMTNLSETSTSSRPYAARGAWPTGGSWKAFSFSPGELFAGRYAHEGNQKPSLSVRTPC
jgi:hypothetical protein